MRAKGRSCLGVCVDPLTVLVCAFLCFEQRAGTSCAKAPLLWLGAVPLLCLLLLLLQW